MLGRGSGVGGPELVVRGPGCPGSGGPVGPGVRAAGLEVGAQLAPRLLVVYSCCQLYTLMILAGPSVLACSVYAYLY